MKHYACLNCGVSFLSRKGCATRTPTFCSCKCSSIYNSARPEVKSKMAVAKMGKRPHNKKPIIVAKCLECETNIGIRIGAFYNPKFCSRNCQSLNYKKRDYAYIKGERSHFWRGGISTENEKARKSSQYRNWRTAIFVRDNYTCRICRTKGGELHADHIKPFAFFKELRYSLENGRTLCINCHYKTDTFGSKALRTKTL